MNKQKTTQWLILGIFVFILTVLAGILTMLIFLAPTAILLVVGLPYWPLLILTIPVGFIMLGWVFGMYYSRRPK
jgi:membrane protein implicated in regulation of membrane protease activity